MDAVKSDMTFQIQKQTQKEIEKIAIRVLILDIHRKKDEGKLPKGTPEEQYTYYYNTWLHDPQNIKAILAEFPELERLSKLKSQSIYSNTAEILERLEQDKENIIRIFCKGNPFTRAISITFHGDAHNGGKQAARVKLDNGVVLYYKPHSLEQHIHYQEIYAYLCRKCKITNKRILYLSQPSYGWEENIKNKSCKTKEEIRNYFYRMGIHLFIGYALSATDLHGENIIAHGEHPVIVDLETFPGYHIQTDESSSEKKIETMLSGSVIHTGMLPILTWGQGNSTVILSAISNGEKITTPFQVPVVKNRNTSNICIAYEPAKFRIKECIVRLNEKIVQPGKYVSELINGFQAAYCAAQMDKKIKKILSDFFNCRARVVLRQTQQYLMYQMLSFHPDFMTDRKNRHRLFSSMHKEGESMLKKQIRDYEADSLMNMDIPYFELEGNSRNLYSGDGRCFKDYFPEAPRKSWDQHMESLCLKDMKRQCNYIRLSMAMLGYSGSEVSLIPQSGHMHDLSSFLREQIHVFISQLCEDAVTTGTDIGWIGLQFYERTRWSLAPVGMYLYGGISGIAVVLGKYLSLFKNEKAKRIFNLILQKMTAYTDSLSSSLQDGTRNTGLFEGEGSIVLSYLILYKLSGNKKLLSLAEKHFLIMKNYIDRDTCSDIFSGIAGAIVAALLLYQKTHKKMYLEEAIQTEKLLWKRRIELRQGVGWAIEGFQKPLAGMAHGCSGILMAYAYLYQIIKDRKYLEKIELILKYEDSLYNERLGNWLDLRKSTDSPQTMNAWCHGAPGILLSRLKLESCMENPSISKDISQCVQALFSEAKTDSFCLCHGLSGNIWIMKKYLKVHKNHYLSTVYKKHCTALFQMLKQKDTANPAELLNPALMTGFSGILYLLLELYQDT